MKTNLYKRGQYQKDNVPILPFTPLFDILSGRGKGMTKILSLYSHLCIRMLSVTKRSESMNISYLFGIQPILHRWQLEVQNRALLLHHCHHGLAGK